MKGIKKYQIGLLLLMAAAVVLLIVVIMLAVGGKQDVQTKKRANEIAEKLNSYVEKKQSIPANLQAAGINDVPSTIAYTKKSDSKYEFCVTYKAEDKGSFTQLEDSLQAGFPSGAYRPSYSPNSSSDSQISLYIEPTHKKGKKCQTIEPYFSQDQFNSDDFNSNTLEDYCKNPDSSDPYAAEFCGTDDSDTTTNI